MTQSDSSGGKRQEIPRASALGVSVIVALISGLLLTFFGFQIAHWQQEARKEAALIQARGLALAAGQLDTSSDQGTQRLQEAIGHARKELPGLKKALVLERIRFLAHSDPDLVGTRLKRDNLAHKALFDDSKALERNLGRNVEEREKYSDLTKNPYFTSIIRPVDDLLYVAVPVFVDGDMEGMVALELVPPLFDTGQFGLTFSLAAVLLIIFSILMARFVPTMPQVVMVVFFGLVSSFLVWNQVQRADEVWQQQLGEAAILSHNVWRNTVIDEQGKVGEATFLAALNLSDHGDTRELFTDVSDQKLTGPDVVALRSGSVRCATDLRVEAKWTWRVLIIALLGLGLYGILLLTGHTRRASDVFVNNWYAYAYISPAVIGTALLVFGPFLFGIVLGFYTRVYSTYEFVGLQNFATILSDFHISHVKNFYRTLGVTVMWTFINVSLHVSIGLGLAMILKDKSLKFTPVYRVLLVVPWALPNYITALIWKGMFNKEYGAVNSFLALVGVEPVSWFNTFWGAFTANVVTNVWLGFPFMMVISLGALQSIPAELYEAADVDGAGKADKFFRITLPLLKPALFPAVILGIIWTFNQFNIIYLVSGGAPNGETDILITEAYRWAFEGRQQFGYAAAYSTIIFMILFGYTYVTNKITKSTEGAYE